MFNLVRRDVSQIMSIVVRENVATNDIGNVVIYMCLNELECRLRQYQFPDLAD